MTTPARPRFPRTPAARSARAAFLAAAVLALAACGSGPGSKPDLLERSLYDYSGAIRWNNFEVAYESIDPERRKAAPLSDFELERLKQVQVVSYNVVAQTAIDETRIAREVEIGVVNRHTQAERTVRVREIWRYDDEAKRWWQVEGLPNFSADR